MQRFTTLKAFQASVRRVYNIEDMNAYFDCYSLQDRSPQAIPVALHVYDDSSYIEQRKTGVYYMELENQSYESPRLDIIERLLMAWQHHFTSITSKKQVDEFIRHLRVDWTIQLSTQFILGDCLRTDQEIILPDWAADYFEDVLHECTLISQRLRFKTDYWYR